MEDRKYLGRSVSDSRIGHRASTLHRESEIKQEESTRTTSPTRASPTDGRSTSPQEDQDLQMNGEVKVMHYNGATHGCEPRQPVAVHGSLHGVQNEFERRLLLAKKLRKAPLPDLSRIVWYHPGISRHIAECLLLSRDIKDGTYLLRDSLTSKDSLTLSVRCKKSVKHYHVIWDGRQFCFGLGKFLGVDGLKEHFDNQPIISGESGVLVQLSYPYPRGVSEPHIYDETTSYHHEHVRRTTTPDNNSVTPDLSINSKEGYLTKLGYHRKGTSEVGLSLIPGQLKEKEKHLFDVAWNWKRRWFVLYRNELKYFATKNDQEALRVIKLEDALVVERDETAGKPFCFRLVTSYRTFFMYATSEAEANEWVEILQWRLGSNSAR